MLKELISIDKTLEMIYEHIRNLEDEMEMISKRVERLEKTLKK